MKSRMQLSSRIMKHRWYTSRSSLWLMVGVLLFTGCNLFDSSDSATTSDVALFPVLLNDRWGYINAEGVMVLQPVYQQAGRFSEGRAPVRFSFRNHFIDGTGEIAIDGRGVFQDVRPFQDGRAAVRLQNRWGFVDRDGQFVINPVYRGAGDFSEDRVFVRSVDFGSYFYLTGEGSVLPYPEGINGFQPIADNQFNDGLALIRTSDRYGFINTDGSLAIEPVYAEALPFSQELAAVKVADRWGYINRDGVVLISPQFISAGRFADERAPVRRDSNQFGYVDTSGRIIISEQFDQARVFSQERAAVQLDGKWGFIDLQGNPVTEIRFDEVEDFYMGLARFTLLVPTDDGQVPSFGYINRDGRIVWPASR